LIQPKRLSEIQKKIWLEAFSAKLENLAGIFTPKTKFSKFAELNEMLKIAQGNKTVTNAIKDSQKRTTCYQADHN